MFCREQVAQLRDMKSDLDELGLDVVVIGNGMPEHAKEFQATEDIPFELFVDPDRKVYAEAGMRRGVNLGTFRAALRALRSGHRQTGLRGDAMQNGGILIFGRTGGLRYRFVSRFSGDLAPAEDLLEAARAASRD